ncbi:MAG: 2-phospho-L-lactate guanylyltransferase [Acidobacteria bacterium]|nr:2-phospho-L-lactate guanylyltransferase [Acidobacteriota bacterium]
MILIPVKKLCGAKQRLGAVLEQSARTELAHAMLADVASSVAASACDDVAVVTSDEFAVELARRHGFEVLSDDANLSETDAIEVATRLSEARGIDSTLVIPADVPLIAPEELRAICDNAPGSGSVLVPSRDMRGTNAALRRPSSLFPLHFGNDSFMPHLAAAIAAATPCVVLSLPGIALDIDTPEDLRDLAEAEGEKQSQILARNFGFGLRDRSRASGNRDSLLTANS